MKCHIRRHFIWVFTICKGTHLWVSRIQRDNVCLWLGVQFPSLFFEPWLSVVFGPFSFFFTVSLFDLIVPLWWCTEYIRKSPFYRVSSWEQMERTIILMILLARTGIRCILLYQLPLVLIALLYVDLINVVYIMACASIRSSWRCTF